MTPAEVNLIYALAEAEANANEDVMLVSPLAVMEVIDLLRRCERTRAAAGMYDELHG